MVDAISSLSVLSSPLPSLSPRACLCCSCHHVLVYHRLPHPHPPPLEATTPTDCGFRMAFANGEGEGVAAALPGTLVIGAVFIVLTKGLNGVQVRQPHALEVFGQVLEHARHLQLLPGLALLALLALLASLTFLVFLAFLHDRTTTARMANTEPRPNTNDKPAAFAVQKRN